MKIIRENTHEIYLELDIEDLPFNIFTSDKTIFVRLEGQQFRTEAQDAEELFLPFKM
jgi:hypothetical protein